MDIAHKVAAYQEAHPEKEIIRLGIGDVTQPLAKCVVDAMHKAADRDGHQRGLPRLRPRAGLPLPQAGHSGLLRQAAEPSSTEDEIFISDGAKSDLANMLGLFDVDNTVLVPDPVYPTYVDDNVTDGRKIIYSRTSQENGFLGMPDDNVKADIIYICSPNNPTGAAYTRDQLKAVGGVRQRRTMPSSCTMPLTSASSRTASWPAASSRSRVPASAPSRSAPSPRSQALPAPAAATPWCPRSWSARA